MILGGFIVGAALLAASFVGSAASRVIAAYRATCAREDGGDYAWRHQRPAGPYANRVLLDFLSPEEWDAMERRAINDAHV